MRHVKKGKPFCSHAKIKIGHICSRGHSRSHNPNKLRDRPLDIVKYSNHSSERINTA
jgi:hypothetical protein